MVTEQIASPSPHKNIAHSSSDSLSEQCSSQQTASLYRINDAITNGPLMVSSSTTQAKRKQKSASEGREKHTTNESVRGKMRLLTNDIRLEYEFFRLLAKEEDIENGVLELADKKLFESTPARPFFVWSIYHYLKSLTGITNHKFDTYFNTCIPLIFELVICVQYYDNHILDNKANVKTKEQINTTRHKAYRLKKLLYQYIDSRFSDIPGFSKWLKTEYINRIFLFVDLGQKIELKFNHADYLLNPEKKNIHIKNFIIEYLREVVSNGTEGLDEKEKLIRENIKNGFEEFNYGDTFACLEQIGNEVSRHVASITELGEIKSFLDIFEEDSWFLKLYFQRISLTSGYLYYSAIKLAIDVLEVQGKLKYNTLQFARHFGITRQLVNDNTDFLPSYFNERTKAKSKKDAFSDLRNGNITLPIFLLWTFRRKNGYFYFLIKHSKALLKNDVPDLLEKIIFQDFIQSHALYFSLSITKKIARGAIKYLDQDNPFFFGLDYMTRGISNNNKYFRHFYLERAYLIYENAKKQFRKGIILGCMSMAQKQALLEWESGVDRQEAHPKGNNQSIWEELFNGSYDYSSIVQSTVLKFVRLHIHHCSRVKIVFGKLAPQFDMY